MRYQSAEAPLSKLEYAQCVAASLAYMILEQQDSVGLVTFDDEIRALVRASSNPSHLKQLLHVMENVQPRRKTHAGPIFHDLAERLKRRGLVIVLSDLFDDVPSLLAGLKHFRHRRHEVVVFQVLDPAELDFPFRQTTLFHGLEQLADVLTDPRATAQGLPGRVRKIPARGPPRLSLAARRLRALAHRSAARRGAVELPGLASQPGKVKRT